MRTHSRLMWLGILLATTSLTAGVSLQAMAQPAAPQGDAQPGAEQAGDPNAEPPALAGRLADIRGTVSFHAAGETQWSAATLNYPVTNGLSFWTEPQAQATLEIADDRLVLDSSTELDVGALDASQIVVTEPQGAAFFNLTSLQPNQTVTFNTPRGAVQITQPGIYEIVAGDTDDATLITVVQGAAHITATNLTLDVGPQQTATIGGTDTLQGAVGAIQQDSFLESMLRAPAPRRFAPSVPRQVQYMTGAADLQTYGSFTQTSEYGQVWYPNSVPHGWAPYRDGHWSYVQPWGWTWVDNARWGFAPFHYGRWVQVHDRWGWVAGEEGAGVGYGVGVSPYPVYSPALVSFVDVGGAALAGVSINFGVGFGGGGYAPAWIPLGPREPYYPWYHVRSDYFARVNAPYGVPRDIIERGPSYNVRNTTIVNNTTINRNVFINQRFATVAPAAAFTRGQSLEGIARPLPVGALEHARPMYGRLPVAPTAETPNLSPAVARRYDVSLPAHPVRPALAGPSIRAEGERAHGVPELRRAGPPPGIRAVPAAQVRNGQAPAPGQERGGEARGRAIEPGMPALRNPGARPDERAGERPGERAGLPGQAPGARAPDQRGQAQHEAPGFVGGARGPEARGPEARGPEARGPEARGPEDRGQPQRNAAPGPNAGAREHGGLPALRGPGSSRPGEAPQAGEQRGPRDQPRPGEPGNASRPGESRPDVNRPEAHEAAPRPGEAARPGERPAPNREQARPELRESQGRPAARPEEQRREAPHPEQRPEAARPGPRAEAPHPAPRAEAPHPEAPRPAPHVEAPRPAPRAEAPRPAPHVEAPRPAAHVEAPRPAARAEAPHPQPHAEAPHPGPHPQPAHPGGHQSPEHKEPPKDH